MKATIPFIVALAFLVALSCPVELFAQGNNLWTGSTGTWTTGGSWSLGDVPDPSIDDRAIVGSTDSLNGGSLTGTVSVGSDIRLSNPAPTVYLGDGPGTTGTLNITGAMAVDAGLQGGDVEVGINNGTGVLNVSGSGILEVEGTLRSSSGNAASTIHLSGSASVTAGSGFLDRQLIIDGSGVSASFTNNLVLGAAGTHTWRIPAAGASTLSVGGNADLDGTLKVEFPNGTPAIGSSWNLIDSLTADSGESPASGFNTVDQSMVGTLPGQKFVVRTTPGGSGTFTQLAFEQHPVLVVDRATGAASLRNFGSAPTVGFDVYNIGSPGGHLNAANWTSIAPANGWVEANPTIYDLSELNLTAGGGATIAGGSSISLGTPVSLPAPAYFGQETEDIRFRFGKPTDSEFREGTVIYTGVPNNTLTLNVDINTGQAQLINGTSFTVSIEGYDISSGTGSLNTVGWTSLDDANTYGPWSEANVSSARLSELLITGGLVVAPNDTIPLGSPFKYPNGFQDLNFQFYLVENSSGDFDADGDVDGQDFLVWQRTDGTAQGLANWQSAYPTPHLFGNQAVAGKVLYTSGLVSLSATLAAVPEPGTGLLLLAGLSLLMGTTRRS